MSDKAMFVTECAENYESIKVQVKFSGLDVATLNLTEKSLNIRGREFPSSRFGTWIFNNGSKEEDVGDILDGGGILAALIWGILKTYPEITAWVTDANGYCFALDVRKSQKKRILNEIGCGKMAKQVEKALTNITVTTRYKTMKVKLIKIMREGTYEKKNDANSDENKNDPMPEFVRLKKLEDAESIAMLMHDGNFSWAFMRLKKQLQNEKDVEFRLQMLMRLAICSVPLKNAEEVTSATDQILKLMKDVCISADHHTEYIRDFQCLVKMLMENRNFIRAIEISFAFNEISKKVVDANMRLEFIYSNLSCVMGSLNELLSLDPGACLTSQAIKYYQQLEKEVDFVKHVKHCNSLVKAQNIYYMEFLMSAVADNMKKSTEARFSSSSKEFNEMVSYWGDFPCIIGKLSSHPITSEYMKDEEFRTTILQISRNPSLLKKKISDVKIAEANEILKADFKGTKRNEMSVNESNKDDIGIATGMFGSSVGNQTKKKKKGPVDKKAEAEIEKEKGNDAYKNKQFTKAHTHYDRAISLDPTNALLHSNKAAVYIEERKFSQAKQSCLHAIRLTSESQRHGDRDVAKILARLARVEMLDGNPENALPIYDRSLRLHHDQKVLDQKKECEAVLAMHFVHSMHSRRFGHGFPFF